MFRDVVWSEGGVDIVVMDSMSQTTDGDRGAVVVAGSNGGQESGRVGVHAGCAFVLLNDAGIGKDRAGVAGLEVLAAAGIPAAAVSHTSAEISHGRDMWEHGVVSTANPAAIALGFMPGELARPLLLATAAALAKTTGATA